MKDTSTHLPDNRGPLDVDQRIALIFTWVDSSPAIQNEIAAMVRAAAQEAFPPGLTPNLQLSGYHIGPMATGLTVQIICTAYENVRPYLNDGATLIAIGQFARAAIRVCRARYRQLSEDHRDEFHPAVRYKDWTPVLSEPMILGLCYQHFADTHANPKQRVSIDSRVRSDFPEMSSASHPGGMETYVVRFWTGQTSYVYVVDSFGRPIEHFTIRGRDLVSLPLPSWFDDRFEHETPAGTLSTKVDVELD
jgi:hypothetical protein